MNNEKEEVLQETEDVKQDESKPKSQKKEKKQDKDSKKVLELEEALKESEDKYLRLFAEYDNYKKRSQKEKEAIYSDAKCDSIKSLLDILDNLERASNVDVENADAKSVVDGVNKILEQAKETFSKMGVEEISAKGEKFDPELHNAVMHEENEEYDENIVSDVFLKGYKLGDRVIRHSMVKVVN